MAAQEGNAIITCSTQTLLEGVNSPQSRYSRPSGSSIPGSSIKPYLSLGRVMVVSSSRSSVGLIYLSLGRVMVVSSSRSSVGLILPRLSGWGNMSFLVPPSQAEVLPSCIQSCSESPRASMGQSTAMITLFSSYGVLVFKTKTEMVVPSIPSWEPPNFSSNTMLSCNVKGSKWSNILLMKRSSMMAPSTTGSLWLLSIHTMMICLWDTMLKYVRRWR